TDRIVIGGRDNTGAAEYDLTGNPTGNTYAGGGGFGQLLDGTTNGVDANYAIECCGSTNSVVVADLNWEGQTVLFDLPDEVNQSSGGSGIAYDSATQSLWVANFSGTVFNLSLSGDVLSSFTVDQPGGKCCLAYDEIGRASCRERGWMREEEGRVGNEKRCEKRSVVRIKIV